MTSRAGNALKIVFLLLLLTSISTAQSTEQYNIVAVEVEGNKVATKSLILGVTSLNLGSPLTQSVIQETMHRLYALGLFRNVRLEAEEVTGGLKVTVIVDEFPKLAGLDITGNDKIKTKKIKEELGLGVGGYISDFLVHKMKQKIKDLYGEKGYFQVEISSSLDYNTDSTEANLTYKVKEHSKVKVEKVIMTGNVRVEANKLIKKMRNRKRGFLKSSDFAQDKYEEDLEKVIAEYHKLGYIDAFLISDSISINNETNRMTIYLEVFEGPQYYFGDITFSGNSVLSENTLRKTSTFETGNVFNNEKYDESLFEVYTTYQEIGHLHARVLDNKTTRNDSIIDIHYEVTEGLPSHIRLVNIVGNKKTKEKVIRRELKVYPGQVFNRSLLIRSIREVMALNYFANVEPVPIDLPNGDVDLEFKVDEKQTGQISAGAGYNSTDKLVGSLGMGIPNLGGNGQNLSFNIEFGSRRNSASVSFTEPYLFGRPTLFGTDLFALNRRWFSDYTEGRQGGAVRIGKRLRWPDNYFRVYATYRIERNRFTDFDDGFVFDNSFKKLNYLDFDGDSTPDTVIASDLTPIPGTVLAIGEKWKAASRISLTITRDSRNLPEFATSGSNISYTFSQTGGFMGGFWNYQKHNLSVAKFFPLFWKFAVAAKLQFGAISSPSKTDETILLSDRFTPGGTAFDGVVRGYDDGSLTPDTTVLQINEQIYRTGNDINAPIDSTTADTLVFTPRVRGNFMLVGNLEIQFPISERSIYGLMFLDAGDSWLRLEQIRPWEVPSSYGFGFRVVVPGIGTIGFDFAYPFNETRNGEDRGWKPHFQIGTTFR